MKAARAHYEELAKMSEDAQRGRIRALKGRELVALLYYAEGREDGETKDRVMVICLMTAGQRYLAKHAAKARRKTKQIL